MFYSHEILTSRKYGVATVWLVATLGAKSSSTKKVTRKAILDVNVKKACKTIMEPEAPMALRLQSNLLYGVSRVYNHQCGYVLADAQSAQNALRVLLKTTNDDALDVNAGRAGRDQLMLEDDPAFMPDDMTVPPLDFDFGNLRIGMAEYQLESQKSMLSPRDRRSRSGSSDSQSSMLGIDIHSSNVGSYQLPEDLFQVSSAQKIPNLGRLFEDEEQALLLDDFDFEFDAEGKIRDIGLEERDILQAEDIVSQYGRIESTSTAHERVRREHDEAFAGRAKAGELDGDGDFFMQFADEQSVLPEAQPFSPKLATPHGRHESDASASPQIETSSDTAKARLKAPRKRSVPKVIRYDEQIEIRNSDLARWNKEYMENMQAAKHKKEAKKAAVHARKNAHTWVFGNGVGNIGQGLGRSHLPGPLNVFTGNQLMRSITGTVPAIRGRPKRAREDEADSSSERRQVRPRPNIKEDNLGRKFSMEDDSMHHQIDDFAAPELGRNAPSALDEHPSSAMPWNVSASLHSFRTQGPGSVGGRVSSIPGRPGSRLMSASPLQGRGNAALGAVPDIERLDEGEDNDFSLAAGGFTSALRAGRGRTLSESHNLSIREAEDFEMFGPAAAVDTQTAAQSQWVKEALAREAMNFLDFVRNSIVEADMDGEEDELAMGQEIGAGEVGFDALFSPEENSAMVAAQAFHHVLTLATKGLIRVRQEAIWADIVLRTF